MADFRPLAALRYDTAVAGDAAVLVAPPYDVVSPAETAALYSRSPFNISRVDYGEERPDDNDASNRYLRARAELDEWRRKGALKLDAAPHLYVYDQEFELDGKRLRRRAVFGRLRVEEFEKGIVLPHEHTGARAKEDRLRLLRASEVHLSPIMALYQADAPLPEDAIEAPVLDAVLPDQRHTLRPLSPAAAQRFSAALAGQRLYIADGHHRYETALNYRNERRAKAERWTGEEPENFVLAALVAAGEPGLVVLPIHRLLHIERQAGMKERLTSLFDVRDLGGFDQLEAASRALAEAGRQGNAFVAVGLEPGRLSLLTVKDAAAVDRLVPAEKPPVWRSLDVAVLHYAVLPTLGFAETPDSVFFSEKAAEVVAEVSSGAWEMGILVNPTRPEQIIAVADAGERMPQKSTFFFPKLGTGVLLYPVD